MTKAYAVITGNDDGCEVHGYYFKLEDAITRWEEEARREHHPLLREHFKDSPNGEWFRNAIPFQQIFIYIEEIEIQ